MSGQPLLFNVESIYDMRSQLVEQSVAIIKSSVVVYDRCYDVIHREIGDAIENDRLKLYVIHPYTCSFTSTLPTVLQAISRAVYRLTQVTASLGVTENYAPLYLLVSSILDAVEEALMDQQNDLDESAIAEMATISLNWGAFAKSVDALQRILL